MNFNANLLKGDVEANSSGTRGASAIGSRSFTTLLLLAAGFVLVRHFVATGSFLNYCFLAAVPLYLRWKPHWSRLLLFLGITLLLAIFSPKHGLARVDPSLGVAALFMMASTLVWMKPADIPRLQDLGIAFAFPIAGVAALVGLTLVSSISADTYDHYLYSWDGSLGCHASTILQTLFARSVSLRTICTFVYMSVPLAICVAFVLGKCGTRLLMASLVAAVLGPVLYPIVPAVGPKYVSASLLESSSAEMTAVPLTIPRNCMPSLHFGWALLIYWFSEGSKWWLRTGWLLYLILTGMATLGLGEHYLVDLIVAVPFSLAIWAALSLRIRYRTATLCITGGITLLWVLILRRRVVGGFAMNWIALGITLCSSLLAKVLCRRAVQIE